MLWAFYYMDHNWMTFSYLFAWGPQTPSLLLSQPIRTNNPPIHMSRKAQSPFCAKVVYSWKRHCIVYSFVWARAHGESFETEKERKRRASSPSCTCDLRFAGDLAQMAAENPLPSLVGNTQKTVQLTCFKSQIIMPLKWAHLLLLIL